MSEVPYGYDELDEIFRGDGSSDVIGLSAIDGLIAGLVCGPQAVTDDTWLALIFNSKMPSRVIGSPESRATATILARYAEVETTLTREPLRYQPIYMHDQGRFITGPWANGFMLGLSQCAQAWVPTLMSPMRLEMAPILASSPEMGAAMLPDFTTEQLREAAAFAAPKIPLVVIALFKHHRRSRKATQPVARRATRRTR